MTIASVDSIASLQVHLQVIRASLNWAVHTLKMGIRNFLCLSRVQSALSQRMQQPAIVFKQKQKLFFNKTNAEVTKIGLILLWTVLKIISHDIDWL